MSFDGTCENGQAENIYEKLRNFYILIYESDFSTVWYFWLFLVRKLINYKSEDL